MSLIGIDVGSSSVKVGAYRESGELVGVARGDVTPRHPKAGWWEQDPDEVWRTASNLVRGLVRKKALKKDPPIAVAVGASVRENFPADSEGKPLGPCIMAADVRGEEFEIPPRGIPLPEAWSLSCGHMRERMDPFNRLSWWQKNHPQILEKAKYFPGWHEFFALRMCGRFVTDRTIAGRWLIYDLKRGGWDSERLAAYEARRELVPEILPWGTVVGDVRREVMEDWGISRPLKMAVGASDLNCAALGAGVASVDETCLASGSFENLLIPTDAFPTAAMLLRGLSVTAHPGTCAHAVWAICPTGTAVLDWARSLTHVSIGDLEAQLEKSGGRPSPVLAVPYLSGAFMFWENGRKLRGAIFGLTLATSQLDVVRAFMESVAYDHVNTLSLLRSEGVDVKYIRAMGGGSRSTWWTQLKADMTGVPIEVVNQPEPGTRGAALLAGLAVGAFGDIARAAKASVGTIRVHEPDRRRAELHSGRLETYRNAVPNTLSIFHAGDRDRSG